MYLLSFEHSLFIIVFISPFITVARNSRSRMTASHDYENSDSVDTIDSQKLRNTKSYQDYDSDYSSLSDDVTESDHKQITERKKVEPLDSDYYVDDVRDDDDNKNERIRAKTRQVRTGSYAERSQPKNEGKIGRSANSGAGLDSDVNYSSDDQNLDFDDYSYDQPDSFKEQTRRKKRRKQGSSDISQKSARVRTSRSPAVAGQIQDYDYENSKIVHKTHPRTSQKTLEINNDPEPFAVNDDYDDDSDLIQLEQKTSSRRRGHKNRETDFEPVEKMQVVKVGNEVSDTVNSDYEFEDPGFEPRSAQIVSEPSQDGRQHGSKNRQPKNSRVQNGRKNRQQNKYIFKNDQDEILDYDSDTVSLPGYESDTEPNGRSKINKVNKNKQHRNKISRQNHGNSYRSRKRKHAQKSIRGNRLNNLRAAKKPVRNPNHRIPKFRVHGKIKFHKSPATIDYDYPTEEINPKSSENIDYDNIDPKNTGYGKNRNRYKNRAQSQNRQFYNRQSVNRKSKQFRKKLLANSLLSDGAAADSDEKYKNQDNQNSKQLQGQNSNLSSKKLSSLVDVPVVNKAQNYQSDEQNYDTPLSREEIDNAIDLIRNNPSLRKALDQAHKHYHLIGNSNKAQNQKEPNQSDKLPDQKSNPSPKNQNVNQKGGNNFYNSHKTNNNDDNGNNDNLNMDNSLSENTNEQLSGIKDQFVSPEQMIESSTQGFLSGSFSELGNYGRNYLISGDKATPKPDGNRSKISGSAQSLLNKSLGIAKSVDDLKKVKKNGKLSDFLLNMDMQAPNSDQIDPSDL